MIDYIFYAFLLTLFIFITIAAIYTKYLDQEGMKCLSSHNGLVWYDPINRRVCGRDGDIINNNNVWW